MAVAACAVCAGPAAADTTLVGDWNFATATSGDSTNHWSNFELKGTATVANGQLAVDGTGNGGNAATAWAHAWGYTGPPITDKTLMAWVSLDSTTIVSGSPMALTKSSDAFDSIVYGEQEANRWRAGSEGFGRTSAFPSNVDDASTGSMRQIAISYADNGNGTQTITGCLNGTSLGSYTTAQIGFAQADTPVALFGPRHMAGGLSGTPTGSIQAHIDESRIYSRAMSCAALADTDADHVLAEADNCPTITNAGQRDTDGDGQGDACDSTPTLVVHRFKFDGSMADLEGGTAAATVSGTASYATGAFGQALSLDGSTQVSLGDALTTGDSAGAGDFTISGTFKTTQNTPSSGEVLVGNRPDGCGGGNWLHVVIYAGHLAVESVAPGSGYTNLNAPGNVADGAFHRFALMRSGTSLTLWQDGVQVAAGTSSGDVRDSTGLQTGSSPCGSPRYNGLLDDVRVQNAADTTASQTILTSTFLAAGNAIDSTAGENATWSGTPGYTTDRQGTANGAFNLSGTNTLTAPAGLDAFGAGDWTVRLWLNSSASSVTRRAVLSTRTGCDSTGTGFALRLLNGVPRIAAFFGGNVSIADAASRADDGTWHQITATRVGNTLSVAVDGIVVGTSSPVSGAFSTGTSLSMGTDSCIGSGDGTQPFTGAIDDIVIARGVGAPAVATAATISGTQHAGQTLTASAAFGGTSPTVAYDWKRCDSAGNNCTTTVGVTSTYTLTATDVGNVIKATVTGTNTAGTASTSAKTAAIAPAAPTFSMTPDATDPRTKAPFAFASATSGVTYECKLDTGSYAVCTSPARVTVANGAHTYSVRAVLNGASSAAASYTWTTDRAASRSFTFDGFAETATGITVDSGQSVKVSATGIWECGWGGGLCDYGPDGGAQDPNQDAQDVPWMALKGKIGATGEWFTIGSGPTLVKGSGELYLAVNDDGFNNSGSLNLTIAPASHDVAITSGPDSSNTSLVTTGTSARFTFTGSTGATFECSYNAGTSWSPCSSPDVHTYTAGTGAGSFRVRATAGGEPLVAIAPLWSVSSAAGPATPVISSTDYTRFTTDPTFTFTSTGATAFECSVDVAAYVGCGTGSKTISGASAGSHTLSVRAYDANGSAASATRTFVKATAAAPVTPQILTTSLTPDTTFGANAASHPGGGQGFRGIDLDSSGNIWLGDYSNGTIHRFASSGTESSPFPLNAGAGYGITDVEVDKDGVVWVARWNDSGGPSSLEKRTASGAVSATYALPANVTGLGSDPITGILYLTVGPGGLYRFDPAAASPSAVLINAITGEPRDVVVGEDGTLYVLQNNGSVTKVSPTGTTLGSFAVPNGPRHGSITSDGLITFATNAGTAETWTTDGTQVLSIPQSVHGVRNAWVAALDSSGRMIVGGAGGLARLQNPTLAYAENDPATAIDSGLALADAATPNLTDASLQISGFHSTEDEITYTLPSGISVQAGGTDPSIGTWTFIGSASVSTWQTFVRSIKFRNTSDTPTAGARGVVLVADAGGQVSNVYQRTITITPANDAPSAGGDHDASDSGTGLTAHLTPGVAQAVQISPTLSDPEGTPTKARIVSIPAGVTVTTSTRSGDVAVAAGDDVDLASGDLMLKVTAPDTADVSIGYRIVDPADSTLLSSASTMSIDVVPALSIDSGPADGSSTTDRTASFAFSGAGTGSHYTCRVDGGSLEDPCTSPRALTGLAAGAHTFSLQAVDAEGDSTTEAVDWTVTNAAPSAGGDRTAPGSAANGSVFTVDVTPVLSDDAGTPNAVRITSIPGSAALTRTDGTPVAVGDDVALTSGALRFKVTPHAVADLAIGYKVVDSADSSLLSPASTISVDVVPVASIDSGPAGGSSVTEKTATFTFSGATAGGSYECKLDADPFAPCTSPKQLTGLTAGSHTFTVKAIDAEGDVGSKARTWTIANDPPSAPGDHNAVDTDTGEIAHAVPGATVAIEVAPTLADQQGIVPVKARIASFPSTVSLTRTDGTPVAAGDDVALSSGKLKLRFASSTPADAVIRYRLVDAADDTIVSASSDLLVDVQPVLSLDSGPADGSSSGQASPTFAFSGAGAGGGYSCSSDGGATGACSSPVQLPNLRWGTHRFSATATDVDGDTDSRTVSWTVTGSMNAPAILAGPAAETGDRAATLSVQGDPGAVPQCSLDGSAFTWCADSVSYTNLALGPHIFMVRQVDAAGNVSPVAVKRWKIDVAFVPGDDGQNIKSVKGVVNEEVAASDNLVGVGCQLNRGSLRQCDVDAYAEVGDTSRKARTASVEKIGSGTTTLNERGQTSAVVDVKLNAVGRKLMKQHPEGVDVTMKIAAQPFDSDQELKSTSKSTMHAPQLLIVPSRGMFAGDSYKLGTAGALYVKAVAKLLAGAKRVRCEGYSDSTASEKRAKAMGYLRAKAVCDALKDQNVSGQIGAIGMGSGSARGDNSTAAGRLRNRRVEIRVWF